MSTGQSNREGADEAGDVPERKTLADILTSRILDDLRESFEREGPKRSRSRGRDKPEGIVTIVFTDVEESSSLVSGLGDERARTLIREHDDLLRTTVAAHDGVEIERAGDGFMIAFSTASRAVEFAVALERALVARPGDPSPIRVRIGMETGEVIAEDQGYFGGTVFRAARISELAHGGQILISHATALIAGTQPSLLADAGDQELRGFGPQRLFEVNWQEPAPG
jgi:eukaryotic-like serine/threonine-protein kinase